IAQPDGSFLHYQWDSDESSPGEPTNWFTSSTENPDELLEDVLDYSGMTDSGTPSTWLQMCYDYANPDQTDLWLRYEISDNMVLSGTENIAGVDCDIDISDTMFNKTEFAYDPATGILFRIGTLDIGGESEEIPYSYTVTEFTDAPATLGTYTE
ncbi:MAG: hypothetical protein LBV41_01265, partial [Cytophagaceae bacterium]|nr:hypothetical protein [Cytophagaceae bacterium]